MAQVYGYLHPNENKEDIHTIPFDILSKNGVNTSNNIARITQLKPQPILTSKIYNNIDNYLRQYLKKYSTTITSHGIMREESIEKSKFEFQLMELTYRLMGLQIVENPMNNPLPLLFLISSYSKLEDRLVSTIDDELSKEGFEKLVVPRKNLTLIKGMCETNATDNYKSLFNLGFKDFREKIMP